MITGATTLWDLVSKRAAESPDRLLFVDEADRPVTCAAFASRVEQVAAGLVGLGIGDGTPVSWQLPTRIDSIVLSMALARVGALQNPILHLYREREVGFALRQTGSRFVFVPSGWALDRSVVPDGVAVHEVPSLPEGDPSSLPPASSDAPVRWIYYTSGSTADPKGVQHTDRTLMAGGYGLARALDLGPDDVGSIAFPFAHIAGPDYLSMMLMAGFPAVLVEAFDLATALPRYREHGVTMAGGATAFYVLFLTEQRKDPSTPILPTLRMLTGGGGPKPPELHFEVQKELGGRGVVHGYGMTEVPMIANGSPHDTDEQLANTDGAPVEGCEVRIVDGEIRVKGPMVFAGYTDPALDAEAFDDEGWFRTGDLGVLRADGHVCVTGRLKDVIIRKGENVSAKEVEDVVYRHPKVAEVAIVGLPDAERGERVCAVVTAASVDDPPTLAEVADFCRSEGLMVQKIPEQLEVRADFPRLGTGKIAKKALVEEYS